MSVEGMSLVASSMRVLVMLVGLCGGALGGRLGAPSAEELADLRRGPCPASWTYGAGRCFQLSDQAATWWRAGELCVERHAAAGLALIDSAGSRRTVAALSREFYRGSAVRARQAIPSVWIGNSPPQTRSPRDHRRPAELPHDPLPIQSPSDYARPVQSPKDHPRPVQSPKDDPRTAPSPQDDPLLSVIRDIVSETTAGVEHPVDREICRSFHAGVQLPMECHVKLPFACQIEKIALNTI